MPALWTEIEGEPWLDNPRRKRRRRSGGHKRRRTRRNAAKGASVARKAHRRHRRRRHHSFMANPHRRRHHRRRFRRNPSFGGITSRIKDGIKGGLGVVAGKVAARAIPTLIGQPRTGVIGIAIQALVGVLGAPVAGKMLGAEFGKAFLWGSFASPIEAGIVQMGVPIAAPALAAYADGGALSAIPYVPGALSALPGFSVSEEDEALVQ